MQVWHTDKNSFGLGGEELTFPQDYTLVAEVETDSPEEAYMLTNTIDQPWHLNEGVKLVAGPTRSSTVGDVFVDGESIYLVLPVGMKKYHGVPQTFPGNLYHTLDCSIGGKVSL